MPMTRTAQPLPVALPGLSVISYGTATALPIGISNDRKTLYGAANGSGTTLYQSVNDGSTWTSVATFTEPALGLLETDDGEALVYTQGASNGFIYKSTGWTTSHTTATWSKKLTSVGGYFRPYWGGGHFCSFGNDLISANTSKVGVAVEYGPQTPNAGYGSRAYLTTNYGATWTQILDLATRYPGVNPLHGHAAAYDPYWDRLWVLYGDTAADGATFAQVLYSDDRGTTWNTLALNGDWIGSSFNFQSTSIAVLRDCLILGSDNAPGYIRLARRGYRQVGDLQVMSVLCGHTGSLMIANGSHRNRLQRGAPLLCAFQSQTTILAGGIYASLDDGATLTRLWTDESVKGGAQGINTVFGPTATGTVVAWVNLTGSQLLLRGELIVPDVGLMDGAATLTGDGATTVFNMPHGLGVTPTRFLAWPEKPVVGNYTVTATSTNIVVTFATAPVNATSLPFSWRAGP